MKRFKNALMAVSALVPSTAMALAEAQCQGLDSVGGSCGGDGLLNFLQTNVVNALFVIAGAIAVVIIIIGGIGYIASTGDPQRITKAKHTILYAVIGLIVVVIARAVVGFVIARS